MSKCEHLSDEPTPPKLFPSFLNLYKTAVVALWTTAPFYLIPGPFDLQFTKALGAYGLYLMGFAMVTSAAGVWGQK